MTEKHEVRFNCSKTIDYYIKMPHDHTQIYHDPIQNMLSEISANSGISTISRIWQFNHKKTHFPNF